MGRFAVQRGIDVEAAGQQDPVHAIQDCAGILPVRQDHRFGAGPRDRFDVIIDPRAGSDSDSWLQFGLHPLRHAASHEIQRRGQLAAEVLDRGSPPDAHVRAVFLEDRIRVIEPVK